MSGLARRLQLTSLTSCASTQLEVRELLDAAPSIVHVVRTDAQHAGLGRHGRTWENPPGAALMLSIGLRGERSVDLLDGLVRRVVDVVARELVRAFELDPAALAWSAPNDLVAARSGAKVAGILVDAVSVGQAVRELRIGIGVNVGGTAWTTARDARAVATLETIAGRALDASAERLDALALSIAEHVLELVDH